MPIHRALPPKTLQAREPLHPRLARSLGFQIPLRRTALHVLRSIHTLRYELLGRAGIRTRPEGRAVLTLAPNLPTRRLFERIAERLGSVA